MLFSNADSVLGWHKTSGPHGHVIRAVAARPLVGKPQEGRHEPLPLLLGNSALPNAMHRGTDGDGVARCSKRFSAHFAGTSVLMTCSGLTGMHRV